MSEILNNKFSLLQLVDPLPRAYYITFICAREYTTLFWPTSSLQQLAHSKTPCPPPLQYSTDCYYMLTPAHNSYYMTRIIGTRIFKIIVAYIIIIYYRELYPWTLETMF